MSRRLAINRWLAMSRRLAMNLSSVMGSPPPLRNAKKFWRVAWMNLWAPSMLPWKASSAVPQQNVMRVPRARLRALAWVMTITVAVIDRVICAQNAVGERG
jgi:hypothetical protein